MEMIQSFLPHRHHLGFALLVGYASPMSLTFLWRLIGATPEGSGAIWRSRHNLKSLFENI